MSSPQFRKIAFVVDPLIANEAPGVHMRRTIGSERLAVLDPLMLLDHLTAEGVSEGRVGFPRHPHRGIETISYVIDGRVFHKDSIGNAGDVGAGEAQWMVAGRGIWHEEMLEEVDGKVEMLQLWFSLPKEDKFIPPSYQPAIKEQIPVHETNGVTIRMLAGADGPIRGLKSQAFISELDFQPGSEIELPSGGEVTVVAYVFRGSVESEGKTVQASRLAVFGSGNQIRFTAGHEGARLLLITARPNLDPIVQYRSFVMNTVDQIAEAEADIASGNFGF